MIKVGDKFVFLKNNFGAYTKNKIYTVIGIGSHYGPDRIVFNNDTRIPDGGWGNNLLNPLQGFWKKVSKQRVNNKPDWF